MRVTKALQVKRREQRERFLTIASVFSIFVSLGFPGKYTELLGDSFSTLCEYSAFFLEIIAMLVSSADEISEIKVIDLRPQYWAIYMVPVTFFALSMYVTIDYGAQLISCIRYGVTVLFALWLVNHYTVERITEIICQAQVLFVAATVLFSLLRPDSAMTSENGSTNFCGIFNTKNNAAAELVLCVLIQLVLFQIKRREKKPIKRGFVVLLAVQLFLLLLCNATGAVFSLILPAIYLFLLGKKKNFIRLPLGVLYIVINILFLVVALTILPLFEPFFNSIGKDATLTGRVPFWKQIVTVATQYNTYTGFGFCMFWRSTSAVALIHNAFSGDSFFSHMTVGAHNTLLEYWLNVGLVGIAVYFFALILSLSHPECMELDQYSFCATFMIWFTVSGLTERLSVTTFAYNALFLYVTMGIASNKRNLKAVHRGERKPVSIPSRRPGGIEET